MIFGIFCICLVNFIRIKIERMKPIRTVAAFVILLGIALVFALSCRKDNNDDSIKQEIGSVWLSGGLAYCAEQIHLDNGDNLIVKMEDVMSFKTGDRVSVKYKEIGVNKSSCSPGIDCEIIEIKRVK